MDNVYLCLGQSAVGRVFLSGLQTGAPVHWAVGPRLARLAAARCPGDSDVGGAVTRTLFSGTRSVTGSWQKTDVSERSHTAPEPPPMHKLIHFDVRSVLPAFF